MYLAISYCETRDQCNCAPDDMDFGSLWLTPGKTGYKTAKSNCVLLQLGVIGHMTRQLTHAHRIHSRVRPLPITNTFI